MVVARGRGTISLSFPGEEILVCVCWQCTRLVFQIFVELVNSIVFVPIILGDGLPNTLGAGQVPTLSGALAATLGGRSMMRAAGFALSAKKKNMVGGITVQN